MNVNEVNQTIAHQICSVIHIIIPSGYLLHKFFLLQDNAKNIEQLLQQWFSIKNDLSLLHPIHSLTQIKDTVQLKML